MASKLLRMGSCHCQWPGPAHGSKDPDASACAPGDILGADASKRGDVWVNLSFRLHSGAQGSLPPSHLEKEAAPSAVCAWERLRGSNPPVLETFYDSWDTLVSIRALQLGLSGLERKRIYRWI